VVKNIFALAVERFEQMQLLDMAFVFEVDRVVAGEAGVASYR